MASTSNGSKGGWASKQKLDTRFPVHTSWEFTLKGEETVQGTIYCTDEASQMRMIQVNSIVRSVQKEEGESAALAASQLPKVQKKALEEREQRALRMAEEMLRHINEKVSLFLFSFGRKMEDKQKSSKETTLPDTNTHAYRNFLSFCSD